jgi:hypothetical protein
MIAKAMIARRQTGAYAAWRNSAGAIRPSMG